MHLTWLDSNSWLIELGGKRILIDPWLVGSLVFGNLDWLFKGSRPQDRLIPENIDLIVLSQGLEDHTHPATLKQLDRTIPVVASASAAKVVQELGYTSITILAHEQTFTLARSVTIEATPGSRVGPNSNREWLFVPRDRKWLNSLLRTTRISLSIIEGSGTN